MKSPTYIPTDKQGWWGAPDTRLRCQHDNKVVFLTQADAKVSASRASGRGTAMKAYCGPCGHWHTSRIKQRGL